MNKTNNKYSKLPGAGPFYYYGNKVGILMIHGGGGGICADLKPLATDIHKKKGYTIFVPLLPGFGTTPQVLKDTTIDDWKSAINQELNTLRERCEKLIIGGHSMGGLLSLIIAAENNLDAIFTIATPFEIKHLPLKLIPIINLFKKYHKTNADQFRQETNGKWVGYDKIPVNIGIKLKNLLREMKNSLSKITCPIILFQGKLDTVIKETSIDKIYEKIKSDKKKKVWLEKSDHPILNIPDHNKIVSELIEYIENLK